MVLSRKSSNKTPRHRCLQFLHHVTKLRIKNNNTITHTHTHTESDYSLYIINSEPGDWTTHFYSNNHISLSLRNTSHHITIDLRNQETTDFYWRRRQAAPMLNRRSRRTFLQSSVDF